MIDYRLYLVTDDPSRYRWDWLDNVVAAVEGGVTCVQYRDTESTPQTRYVRVRRLQEALKARRVPLVVNNDVALAAEIHAEGVHVGQSDMKPASARALVGPDCEIGLSITEISQVDACASRRVGGISCLGIGPVFDARKTKADAADALGVEGLAQIVSVARGFSAPGSFYPQTTVAIGGITLENASSVLSTGVGGLAVVSAFSQSENPHEVARNFRMLFDNRRQ